MISFLQYISENLEEKSECYKMRTLLDGVENGSAFVGKEGWNTLAKIAFSLEGLTLDALMSMKQKEIFKMILILLCILLKENVVTNSCLNLKCITDIWGCVKETLYVWGFSSWDVPILYLLIDTKLIFLFVKDRWTLWSLMNKAVRCLRMLDMFRNSTDFIFRAFLMTPMGCWVSWCIGTHHLLLEIFMLLMKKTWEKWPLARTVPQK